MTISAREVTLSELAPTDIERWWELARDPLEPNPFLSPSYVVSADRWLERAQGMRFVIVEDEQRMRAICPLGVERRLHGLPIPYVTTASPFFARSAAVCAPLVDKRGHRETVDALFEHLADRRAGLPGLFEMTLFPEGPLLTTVLASCSDHRMPVVERYRFDRACLRLSSTAAPRARLSARRRKNIARATRDLEAECGGPLELTDLGADPAALDILLDLEAKGWKGDRGHHGAALRTKPGAAEWFTDVAAGLREHDDLHLLVLRAGPDIVYAAAVLQSGDTLFGYLDTYDERWAAFGPGVIGRVLAQEHFVRTSGARRYDPCVHPKNVVAASLYPDARTLVGLLVGTHGPVNKTIVRRGPQVVAAARAFRDRLPSSAQRGGS